MEQNSTLTTEYVQIDEVIYCLICSFGSITSIINILVLSSKKLKDSVYNYYLASSIIDLIYAVIIAFKIFITCGSQCLFRKKNLSTLIYILYFQDYFTSCLAINNILIEVFVSFQRFMIITNKKFLQNSRPILVIISISVFSLIYYLPVIFLKNIVFESNDVYALEYTKFGSSSAGKVFSIVLSLTRLVVASVVLFIINWFNLIRFRKLMVKKSNLAIKISSLRSNFIFLIKI